jgi:1,4-dihydroxy-2-naphthoate octaprenyltransferase
MTTIKQNSLQAWLLATRPKTLAAGSVPVVVASALAWNFGAFRWQPALLCLTCALLAQIASNFSNDYFDFVKKTDNEERLGPARAVASGWISPRSMLVGTGVVVFLACIFGLGLVAYGGWAMVAVGAICVLALLAYTAGPFPLAYNGLGDVFVFLFFGLTAVVFTFYLQTGYFHYTAFVAGATVGLGAVNILVVNNFRDRENDRASRKRTSIVLFGEHFGKYFYLINGFLAVALCFVFWKESTLAALLPLIYIPLHISSWRAMCRIYKGKGLNRILGQTARNLVVLGGLLAAGLFF